MNSKVYESSVTYVTRKSSMFFFHLNKHKPQQVISRLPHMYLLNDSRDPLKLLNILHFTLLLNYLFPTLPCHMVCQKVRLN